MNYKTKDDAAYHTFWLMLRNNGIATHGKCTNKNINNDLMQTYKKEIKLWKYNASSKEVNVRQSLQSLVQDTLAELRRRLRAASSDPELKQRVNEALEKLFRRIRMVQKELSEQGNGCHANFTYVSLFAPNAPNAILYALWTVLLLVVILDL